MRHIATQIISGMLALFLAGILFSFQLFFHALEIVLSGQNIVLSQHVVVYHT
jgi:hypothetical protein